MEIKNFTITKRDGSKDRFSLDKIMNAITKAFESVEEPADLGAISKIISHLDIHDDIKVEDIQNQVEEALMREGYFKVAKSFILYRQEHTEDRETLEKMMFLSEYMEESKNAATGSKYDANANVEHKNIATLIGELPKSNFIRLNRRLLVDRIKKMYGKQLAECGIKVTNIDNPVGFAHFESNAAFVQKTEEAIATLYEIREKMEGYSRLLTHERKLKRWHIAPLLRCIFSLTRQEMRDNLCSPNPNLRVFDFYKLLLLLNLDRHD